MKLIITDDFGATLIEASIGKADVIIKEDFRDAYGSTLGYYTPPVRTLEIDATLVGDENQVFLKTFKDMDSQPISFEIEQKI